MIDELSIDFTSGLNVLTGETGAGKSIIIDAINLIIGERASTDFIRTGKQNASVEALFSYNNLLVDDILREYGVEPEDNKTLIISRELSLQGRSICRANGKMVTVSALKRIGNLLIDIHGQHQHQSLLDSKNHIRLLDLYGYDEISVLKKNVSSLYNKYRNLCKELESLKTKHKDFEKQQDRLRFEVNEIEQAQLKPDEETQLEEEKKILENAEKISNVLEEAYNLLYEGYQTPSIIDNLNKTVDAFEDIKDYYQILTVVLESLTNMLYELEDISTTIRKLKDSIDFDAGKLNVINSRLEMINRIKSKYNKSIPELLTYKEEAAAQLTKPRFRRKINDLNCQLANIKQN